MSFNKATALILKVKYLFPPSHWDCFTPMSRNLLTSSSILILDYAHFMLICFCTTYSETVEVNYIFELSCIFAVETTHCYFSL